MLSGTTLHLTMQQQYARIGIESKPAKLEISQPQANMQIRQITASMQIIQGPGELQINSEDARAALGQKGLIRFMDDITPQANQNALDAIGIISAEGDQLGSIDKGVTVADVAAQRFENGIAPIDFTSQPSQVHITYTPHPFHIDWQLGKADIAVTAQPPQFTYTAGSVNVYLQQRNSLQIDVKGKYLNMEF